jgi:hypothetical protein
MSRKFLARVRNLFHRGKDLFKLLGNLPAAPGSQVPTVEPESLGRTDDANHSEPGHANRASLWPRPSSQTVSGLAPSADKGKSAIAARASP